MSLRGLRLATQFLTRIPVPTVSGFSPDELSRSAAWFPFVGGCLGILVALVVAMGTHANGILGAALGVLAWSWVTGALHLDGLADLTDALAASHRDPQRFFAVLADPRIGTFGVVSIVLALMLKWAALTAVPSTAWPALALIPAWARLGPLVWSRWLGALKPGSGERFAWNLHAGWIVFWMLVLLLCSAAIAPVLCAAPLVLAGWGIWLYARLGGFTGDCLGAGVEITEVVLVVALACCGSSGAPLRLGFQP
ncbi:MAG TPA: adenosylcobinamide-GDP ribazoletransferase [Steroidobacteraceae bacterium]|nr:adenosylcobinamide-GDP ribazoletransferase [Steroidobacteraceae bacterium]